MVTCSLDTHQHDTTTGHRFLRPLQISQADVQYALQYLHINAYGEVDKLSIKDNFNTLIESTNLIQAASRETQIPQYKL